VLGLSNPNMMALSTTDTAAASSYVVYTGATYAAWRAAIDRLLEEAKGLHADGVVAVELAERRGKGDVREFVATGTAVRSTGATHLNKPFTTTLSGEDVAKLMSAGWMPASIILGLSVAIRHDPLRVRLARARLTAAREIVNISELAHAARAHARQQLSSRTREAGGDGAILTSQVTLSIEERAVSHLHHDIVAEARATATAIVEFAADREGGLRRTASTSVISVRR
jgi:uncharacterized protein YbjQ (UPF0145 family)